VRCLHSTVANRQCAEFLNFVGPRLAFYSLGIGKETLATKSQSRCPENLFDLRHFKSGARGLYGVESKLFAMNVNTENPVYWHLSQQRAAGSLQTVGPRKELEMLRKRVEEAAAN
jgi:hypothetical protein